MLPEKLTIHTMQGERSALFVGPSMWGYIYREENGGYFYRIIPIEDVQYAETRHEIGLLKKAPRQPQVAPIVEADQEPQYIDNKVYFYIRYEIDPTFTWLDIIRNKDTEFRFQSISRVLKAVHIWLKDNSKSLLIMPSDLVFVDHTPFLLKLPSLGKPRIDSLFTEPSRILYMAPEMICGLHLNISPENVSLYALGMVLLQSIYNIQADPNPESLLTDSANGTLTSSLYKPMLQQWMLTQTEIKEMVQYLERMINRDLRVRNAFQPMDLHDSIKKYIGLLNPKKTVRKLMKDKKYGEAYKIIQNILKTVKSSTMFKLAGELANEHLNKPLEAVEHYEKAIKLKSDDIKLYIEQIKIYLDQIFNAALLQEIQVRPEISQDQIRARIKRDFERLDFNRQADWVEKVAAFLNIFGDYESTEKYIDPHLYDADSTELWFKFGRYCLYVEAMIGLKQYDSAAEWIKYTKGNISKAIDHPNLRGDVKKYGPIISELERRLLELRKQK